MHKIKSFFAVLLTVVVVAACAMLPTFVAGMQDNVQQDEITVGDVNEVKLEVEKLNMFEKLFLFREGQSIIYKKEKTELINYDMETMVSEQLGPYVEAGLIPGDIDDLSMEATPMLYFYSGKTDLSHVFWNINFFSQEEPFYHLELYVDDETGKIIVINLYCDVPIYDNNMYEKLQMFLEIYISNMEDELEYVSDAEIVENANTEVEVISAELRWGDLIYGELTLEFTFSPYSFYNWPL